MPSTMPIGASGSVRESSAVAIRSAIEADLLTVVGIYTHHVRAGTTSSEVDAPDLTEMTRRLHALQEAGVPYVVVEAGGALLSYAYAGPHHAQPAYHRTVKDSIYLDIAAQERGVGTLLLKALIHEYQAHDFEQIVAVVGGGRENPGSTKLHTRCGFREVGVLEMVGYEFGRWLDCLLMQRALRGSGIG